MIVASCPQFGYEKSYIPWGRGVRTTDPPSFKGQALRTLYDSFELNDRAPRKVMATPRGAMAKSISK